MKHGTERPLILLQLLRAVHIQADVNPIVFQSRTDGSKERQRIDRIVHYIKRGDYIKVFRQIPRGIPRLKTDTNFHASHGCVAGSPFDSWWKDVKSYIARLRKCLSELNKRSTPPAAYVSHKGPALKLVLHVWHCRNPLCEQKVLE